MTRRAPCRLQAVSTHPAPEYESLVVLKGSGVEQLELSKSQRPKRRVVLMHMARQSRQEPPLDRRARIVTDGDVLPALDPAGELLDVVFLKLSLLADDGEGKVLDELVTAPIILCDLDQKELRSSKSGHAGKTHFCAARVDDCV